MDEDKFMPAWVFNILAENGNVILPTKIVKKFGMDNIQLVMRHVMGDDSVVVESEIWYDQYPNGRLRKNIGYHARMKKWKTD